MKQKYEFWDDIFKDIHEDSKKALYQFLGYGNTRHKKLKKFSLNIDEKDNNLKIEISLDLLGKSKK